MTEYRLASKLDTHCNGVALVGCGGTGSLAAEGLCRLLAGRHQIQLILIDGDRVEERNLSRQGFGPEDLGRFKSQALAERLARRHGRPVAYTTSPLLPDGPGDEVIRPCALVVGCVDNAPARAAIAGLVSPRLWWVDAGNGREHGQVLVGNGSLQELGERLRWVFDPEAGLCEALPLPTLVRPELLVVPAPEEASCADAAAAGEQGPTINQFMAVLVVEAVRRLLAGELTWWQAYLDLEVGTLHTVRPSPEAVSRLTGVKVKGLMKQPERR